MYNLRPYDQPVASAITLVGMIYMLIFSFIIAMLNNGAREIMYVARCSCRAMTYSCPCLSAHILGIAIADMKERRSSQPPRTSNTEYLCPSSSTSPSLCCLP